MPDSPISRSMRVPVQLRIRRWALLLGVTLWAVLGINLSSPGVVAVSGHLKGEDYAHFYVLGRIARDGHASLLYDTFGQAAYLTQAIPGADVTYFVPVYGPQVALAFLPLALLPYVASLAIWMATTIALFLVCCAATYRICPRLHAYRSEIVLLAVGSPALWQLVLHGQTTAVALGAFTAGWMCLRSRRDLLAGALFGILFYKPQLAITLCAVLALTGRWKVLAAMAAAAALQLGGAVLCLGPAALYDYAAMLIRLPAVTHLIEPKPYLMHSFRAFFAMLPVIAPLALALSVACSLMVLSRLVSHWKSSVDRDASFAMLLVATVLISGHSSVYDLVVLAPALLVIADRLLALASAGAPASSLRTGWILLGAAHLLPLWSTAAAWLHVQPMVICLTVLLFHAGRMGVASSPARAEVEMVPA